MFITCTLLSCAKKRECDAFQAVTVIERTLSNARHAIRDGDARQASAPRERLISYARHAIRDSDARQAAATLERIIVNARQLAILAKGDVR